MSTSIQRLKKLGSQLRGTADPSVTVPFELKCDCGTVVRGTRRNSWIEAECPECCHSLFVLPANVYPSTPSVPSNVISGSFLQRLHSVTKEIFAGSETAEKSSKPAKPTPAEEPRPCVRLPSISLPKINIKAALKRTFTPFRMLMLCMITVVAMTGYWMMHQQSVEAAQQTWLRTMDEIAPLLARPDMINLEATLNDAVSAGRVLGKQDPEWRLTLNLLRETQAVNSIASGNILNAFHRAYDDNNRLVSDALKLVQDDAQSGVLILDSFLKPGVEDKGRFLIELPATPGRHAVQLTVSLPALAEFLNTIDDKRAVFALRISEVTAPEQGGRQPWILKAEPTSFVLLTHAEHCKEVGLSTTDDPELAVILQRQKAFVESSAAWEHRCDNLTSEEQQRAITK